MTLPYPRLEREAERLAALRRLAILDTPPEDDFDAIVRLIATVCETPVALVSLVDADRQWFKANLGFSAEQTSRDVSFCAHALVHPQDLLVVPDATHDARFAGNPLVTGEPFIRFYAGAPLVTESGEAIGTVCVLDTKPRVLSNEQQEALRLIGRVALILMERRQTIDELHALRIGHEQANRRLQFLANHDGLTSLPNRAHFLESVEAALAAGEEIGVGFVDIDRFKAINDTYGHAIGDELLVEIARRIREIVRPEDVVARLGGDEFTICFRGIASDDELTTAASHVLATLLRPYRLAGAERDVAASIGLARCRSGCTVKSLLREADFAMYLAKAHGSGSIQLFEPELHRT